MSPCVVLCSSLLGTNPFSPGCQRLLFRERQGRSEKNIFQANTTEPLQHMALATIFQSLGISNKKGAAPGSKNDDMRNEQLNKATALYNYEIQVARTINYMTPAVLRGRLDYMRENNATYSQSIVAEIKRQQKKILELETSFTSINLTADEQKEAEELFTKIDTETKRLKELEMELQASKAFYINNDLIRARLLDMKTGSTYEEIVTNEKESWLEIHQVFNSKAFFPLL